MCCSLYSVDMRSFGKRGIHYFQRLNDANIPTQIIENGQNRVVEASLTLIRERAKLKVNTVIYSYSSF